jgi:hypothetical protein
MGDYEFAAAMGRRRHQEDRAYFQPAKTADSFLAIYDELLIADTKKTVARAPDRR